MKENNIHIDHTVRLRRTIPFKIFMKRKHIKVLQRNAK